MLGHDPYRERAAVRPRTGVMLQEGGFPSDLTVAETASMWAGTLTAPRPIAEALAMVTLGGREDVPVKQLSGGERRRLDLALALLGRPEVLFLDEPTTGLDPESRRNTWNLVRELLDDGTTVLLTTHYMDEAEQLADRLAIMHQGRIVHSGTVADVLATQPSTISFERHDGPAGPALPDLPGALVVNDTRSVVIHTDTLQDTLTTVLLWARQHEVELHLLSARTASLEQAFMAVATQEHTNAAEEALV